MKLTANGPVKHDGELIEEGESFDVKDAKKAKALVEQGIARSHAAAVPSAPKQGDANAQTGVTGDPGTKQGAPVPTTPGPAASDDNKKS